MGSQLKQTVSETVLATTADLSTVVHTTGNESVSGVKTFANNLFVGDGSSNNVIIANNAIKQMVNGTTKTYNFPASGGTLELQGHKHSELNAYYTTIAVVDNMDETGGQIRRENITLGMLFDNISITDPSNNNTQLLIKIGIPVTDGNFTNDSLYTVSKINLEIYDVTKSEYIIEWQSIAIDHTKDNQGRNFFLEENGFTVNPDYTFAQYDWTQYLSSAPFMLTKEQNDTYTFYESWGPLSTSKSSLSPSAWTGNSNQQIATVDLVDDKLSEYAKNNHTHSSIITPVGSAELNTDVWSYGGIRSSLYVHSPSGSDSYPPAIFIGSGHGGDYDSSYNIQIDTLTGGMSIFNNRAWAGGGYSRPVTRYLIDRIERNTSADSNTYSLLFPTLTADETIATVPNGSEFIPYYDASLKSVTLGSGVSTGRGSLALVSANALGNGSIAMGTSSVSACGAYTIAMGAGVTMTSGTMGTFAHGNSVSAIGRGCHAEGRATIAGGTATTFAAHSEGWNTSAFANYSHSEGVHVGIPSADKFAYAWNGVDAASASGGYSSHGEGTYNINPKEGISGFYIGDTPLSTTLASFQTTADMSNYQTVSAMTAYQTTAGMSDYQPVSAMTEYASSTHTHSASSITYTYSGNSTVSGALNDLYDTNLYLTNGSNLLMRGSSAVDSLILSGNKTVATTDQIPSIPSTTALLKGNGSGGISAAVAGTDYLTTHQTLKTINNTSLIGTGNIAITPGDTNIIETIKVNGSALTPDANKAVDITIPNSSMIPILDLYVDASTPTVSFTMDQTIGWYRGCIGSDGMFPTFDWTNFTVPADRAYQFTVHLFVNSSATTLTDTNGVSWTEGAGLPTSSFAGKWLVASFIKAGWSGNITGAVWRCQ